MADDTAAVAAKDIIAKCEQYWNEHNINDAEVHCALEAIHRNAHILEEYFKNLEAENKGLRETLDADDEWLDIEFERCETNGQYQFVEWVKAALAANPEPKGDTDAK